MKKGSAMEIRFKTLTPIFTGNITGNQNPKLLEKGIMGHLRFWAGAILRGLGHPVPSATQDHPDVKIRDNDELATKVNALDPASRVFGCTGWGRIFKLIIDCSRAPNLLPTSPDLHVLAFNHGWSLKPGYLADWTKTFSASHLFRTTQAAWVQEATTLLGWTWRVIGNLAGIGGHQAWGYGQIRLDGELPTLTSIPSGNDALPYGSGLPDLADFVFAEYEWRNRNDLTLRPLGGRATFFEEPGKGPSKWSWRDSIPARCRPVGLSLRYLLGRDQNYPSTIKEWGEAFYGDSAEGSPAGRLHGSFLYKVDEDGLPAGNGSHLRFRLWAWLPKAKFRSTSSSYLPSWDEAATALYDEFLRPALWAAIGGAACPPPTPVYFWPLTSSTSRTELHALQPLLASVENRARTVLHRTSIWTK